MKFDAAIERIRRGHKQLKLNKYCGLVPKQPVCFNPTYLSIQGSYVKFERLPEIVIKFPLI